MKNGVFYTVWVRPVGSLVWTYHTRPATGTIFRTTDPDKANTVARVIVEKTNYCARVVAIRLPDEVDETQYALLSDGDTMFCKVQQP